MGNIFSAWGRPAPADALIAWGARAIFTGRRVDLLPDRQSFSVESEFKAEAEMTQQQRERMTLFVRWLQYEAMPWLKKEAKRLSEDSGEVIELDEGNYHIEASPQRSHGYLYIGAWEENHG